MGVFESLDKGSMAGVGERDQTHRGRRDAGAGTTGEGEAGSSPRTGGDSVTARMSESS